MSGPLCSSGKARYSSQTAAQSALVKVARRMDGGEEGRRPGVRPSAMYRCKACDGWHLATHGRKVRRGVLGNEKRGRR